MLFIDIGAEKGKEVGWALDHGYEVHAFEPNPHMIPYLSFYEGKARIHYAAAWRTDGVENLYLMASPEPGEEGLSLVEDKTNVSKNRFLSIPTINIGKYLKKLDKDVDILKIDAEGAEYVIIESVLDHFGHKRVKRWLVEDHENYIKSEKWSKKKNDVLERLKSVGVTLEEWKGLL